MKVCKYCGDEWGIERLLCTKAGLPIPEEIKPTPDWVVEGPDYSMPHIFEICRCPCHWQGDMIYRVACREILGLQEPEVPCKAHSLRGSGSI